MLALELPVRSLLVLALVHGYSRNADGWFCYKYKIAERLVMHPSGVSRALNCLFSGGLIKEIWDCNGHRLETPSETDYSGPFILVYDWMFDRYLTGRELLVYALIYGFCRDGKQCYGNRNWIEKKLHITNAGKVITHLKKRGLVKEIYKPDKTSILTASWGAKPAPEDGLNNNPPTPQSATQIAEMTFNGLPF